MAVDLQELNLRITGEMQSATQSIDACITSLGGLRNALESIGNAGSVSAKIQNAFKSLTKAMASVSESDVEKLATLSNGLAGLGDALTAISSFNGSSFEGLAQGIAKITAELAKVDPEQLEALRSAGEALAALNKAKSTGAKDKGPSLYTSLKTAAGWATTAGKRMIWFGKVGANAISGIVKSMKSLGDKLSLNNTLIGKFMQKLAGRAVSMAMRAIIKSITSAFSNGLEALYHYSGEVKKQLDGIATQMSGLKASAGSSLYSAITLFSGAIETLISVATSALNVVSQLFSALAGSDTYFKGVSKSTEAYSDSTKKAKNNSDKLKSSILGFDEINKLTDPKSSSSGSTSKNPDWMSAGTFKKAKVSDLIKNAVKTGDFTLVGRELAKKISNALSKINWSAFRNSAVNIGKSIATFINGLFSGLNPSEIGSAIMKVIGAAIKGINKFWYTVDWSGLGEWVRRAIKQAFSEINPNDIGDFIIRKLQAISKFLIGLLDGGFDWTAVEVKLKQILTRVVNGVKDIDFKKLGQLIATNIREALNTIRKVVKTKQFKDLLKEFASGISSLVKEAPAILGALADIAITVWNTFVDAMGDELSGISFWDAFKDLAEQIKQSIDDNGGIRVPVSVLVLFAALTGLEIFKTAFTTALNGVFLSEIFKGGTGGGLKKVAASGVKGVVGGIGVGVAVYGLIKAFSVIQDSVVNKTPLDIGSLLNDLGTGLVGAGAAVASFGVPIAGVIIAAIGVILKIAGYLWDYSTASDDGLLGYEGNSVIEDIQDRFAESGKISVLYDLVPQLGLNWDKGQFETVAKLIADTMGIDGKTIKDRDKQVAYWETLYTYLAEIAGVGTGLNFVTDLREELYGMAEASGDFDEAGLAALAETLGIVSNNSSDLEDATTGIDSATDSYNLLTAAGTEASEQMDNVVTVIHEIPTTTEITLKVNGYTDVMTKLNAVITKLASITSKTVTVSVNTVTTAVSNVVNAKKHAAGGFTSAGEVFIAGEKGAELVGSINGRNAVANQAEIGDAIFRYMSKYGSANQQPAIDEGRLASAIVSACRSAGMGAVYLDGKQLAQSINRESMRIGKSAIKY